MRCRRSCGPGTKRRQAPLLALLHTALQSAALRCVHPSASQPVSLTVVMKLATSFKFWRLPQRVPLHTKRRQRAAGPAGTVTARAELSPL